MSNEDNQHYCENIKNIALFPKSACTCGVELEERRSLKSRRLNAEIQWTDALEAFKSANRRSGPRDRRSMNPVELADLEREAGRQLSVNAAHLFRRRKIATQHAVGETYVIECDELAERQQRRLHHQARTQATPPMPWWVGAIAACAVCSALGYVLAEMGFARMGW